jgi:hypothetical protein
VGGCTIFLLCTLVTPIGGVHDPIVRKDPPIRRVSNVVDQTFFRWVGPFRMRVQLTSTEYAVVKDSGSMACEECLETAR